MVQNIKNYFPGGNTGKGFFSFYNYILPQETAKRIICIKGGPGTGKSSLMKNVGEFFKDRGYSIEYHHCSSDNNSLDGVVIKGLNVAILDGTAPHVVDPKNPGAVDEVLNMGDCWNEEGFSKFREEIISHNKKVHNLFETAYRYLGAASKIYEDMEFINDNSFNMAKINKFIDDIKMAELKGNLSSVGEERHIFATAFTPLGIVTYINNLMEDYDKVYCLNGCTSKLRSKILYELGNTAIRNGYYVEFMHNPLVPSEIEHILIPELSLSFVTANEINNLVLDGKQIYLDNYTFNTFENSIKENLEKDKMIFNELIGNAISYIKNAKLVHDEMEKYYVPNMDFDKVNKTCDNVINKILSYEK